MGGRTKRNFVRSCLLLSIVAIIVVGYVATLIIVGIIQFARTGTELGRESVADGLELHYGTLVAAGRVPEAHQPLFDAIVAAADRPNTMVPTTLLCGAVVQSALADGELTDAELEQARIVGNFLKDGPPKGHEQHAFFEAYPDLDALTRSFGEQFLEDIADDTEVEL